MKFTIPKMLQSEHKALHDRLRQATEVGGEVGEAAKTLAHLMHPHFVKEDEFALPPLGLLVALASGEVNAEMAAVLELTDRLETEEAVMYPASIMVGQVVRQRLGIRAEALA